MANPNYGYGGSTLFDKFMTFGAPAYGSGPQPSMQPGMFDLGSFMPSLGNAAPLVPPAGAPGSTGMMGGMFDGFLGSTDKNGIKTDGWGGSALSAVQGLGSAYMGMKQYGLAKDALATSKKQFQMNYDAQKATTNASLEDRQNARVASNPNAYQSVGAYMNKNGIK